MKVVVSPYKRISAFITLFRVHNRIGRLILEEVGKKYLDNTDLYALKKIGFKVIVKTHTNRKKL